MKALSELVDVDIAHSDLDEPFVDLKKVRWITVDLTRKDIYNDSPFFSYVRAEVAERLKAGAYDHVFNQNKANYPNLAETELHHLTSQYVAPLGVAGHPTGGAFDVTLLRGGAELYLGSRYNEIPEKAGTRNQLGSLEITSEEKEFRQILRTVLEPCGFVNDHYEWWHWSYGDKYWAFLKNTASLYSAVGEQDIREQPSP